MMIDRHREVYGINQDLANQILLKYKPSKKDEDDLKKRLERLEKKHALIDNKQKSINSDLLGKTLSPSAVTSTIALDKSY